MNELTLADLDMGTCLPQVLSTSKPTLDRRGVSHWLRFHLYMILLFMAQGIALFCVTAGQPLWSRLKYLNNYQTDYRLDIYWTIKHYLLPFLSHNSPQGLWLELELLYTGCFQMTLETKMNLCKLGKDGESEAHSVTETRQTGWDRSQFHIPQPLLNSVVCI